MCASGVADLEAESVDSGTSRHNGLDATRSELAKTERRVRTSGRYDARSARRGQGGKWQVTFNSDAGETVR